MDQPSSQIPRPFWYLVVCQFLGSANDQAFKFLITFFLIRQQGIEHSAQILSVTSLIFVIPFLLFSDFAGTLADRYRKNRIACYTKILEIVTMALGFLGFVYQIPSLLYATLFLMSTQSALFTPAKLGMIPEIVPQHVISKANGSLSLCTFGAIIAGSFLGSFLTQVFDYNFPATSLCCIVMAIVGTFFAFLLPTTPPGDPQAKASPNILSQVYRTMKMTQEQTIAPGMLFTCIFCTVYFMYVGPFMQLAIVPYAIETLDLSEVEAGYLFLALAIGIGTGSFFAGKTSGESYELGYTSVSSILVTATLLLLAWAPGSVLTTLILLFVQGFASGLFIVPVDSYIQIHSPSNLRGRILASINFFSFLSVLLASGTLYLFSTLLHLPAIEMMSAMGMITLVSGILIWIEFFDFITRFCARILGHVKFSIAIEHKQHIPQKPAIYVCPHTAWHDTLLILASQPRRIRFFLEESKKIPTPQKKPYHLLKIVRPHPIEPFEQNSQALAHIQSLLAQGFSICIFIHHEDTDDLIERLKHSPKTQSLQNTPIVALRIHKNPQTHTSRFKTRLQALITYG